VGGTAGATYLYVRTPATQNQQDQNLAHATTTEVDLIAGPLRF
jgi:hypothetical protein